MLKLIWEYRHLSISNFHNNIEELLRSKFCRDRLIIDISGPVFDEDSFNQNVYIGISKDAYKNKLPSKT